MTYCVYSRQLLANGGYFEEHRCGLSKEQADRHAAKMRKAGCEVRIDEETQLTYK